MAFFKDTAEPPAILSVSGSSPNISLTVQCPDSEEEEDRTYCAVEKSTDGGSNWTAIAQGTSDWPFTKALIQQQSIATGTKYRARAEYDSSPATVTSSVVTV